MKRDLSVIMPMWNTAEYVEEAARSVLENADGLLELIVVDDGSDDDGAAIVEGIDDERVILVRQPHAGTSAARNKALRIARGELIGFLDSDDIWVAGTPDPRRSALAGGADFVMGTVQPVAGNPLRPYEGKGPSVQLGTMLARREVLLAAPEFDEARLHGEDVDWFMKLREGGVRMAQIDEVVVHYRLRHGSLTRDRETNRAAIADVLHASLVRRGKMGAAE